MPQTTACDRSAQLLAHGDLVRRTARRLLARVPGHVRNEGPVQAGMIGGLDDAPRRFHDDCEAAFGTYAARRIEGAMLDELRATDPLPRGVRDQQRQIRAAVQRLEHELGRAPRAKEVADALGWTLARFHQAMVAAGAGGLRAGDRPLEEEADAAPEAADELADDGFGDPARRLQLRQRLEAFSRALHALADREQHVMEMVYERGMRLREVGFLLGVTESRVSQIHAEAVAKLRRRLRDC